jgi:hypothetical protein
VICVTLFKCASHPRTAQNFSYGEQPTISPKKIVPK